MKKNNTKLYMVCLSAILLLFFTSDTVCLFAEKADPFKTGDLINCYVTSGHLNIRKSPDIGSEITGKFLMGRKAYVTDIDNNISKLNGKDFRWIKIKTLHNDKAALEGWAASLYVKKIDRLFTAEKKNNTVIIHSGAEQKYYGIGTVMFSPDSKWTALQVKDNFTVIPAAELNNAGTEIPAERHYAGRIIGFTSSRSLLFATDNGIYRLNPDNLNIENLFVLNTKTLKTFYYYITYSNPSFLLLKNGDIIIKNQYISLKKKKARLLKINSASGDWMASAWQYRLSSSERYFSHEYGDESSNFFEVFDLKSNTGTDPVIKYKLITNIKKYGYSSVLYFWHPRNNRMLLSVADTTDEMSTDEDLFYLNYDTGKVLWKKKRTAGFFPTDVSYLKNDLAVISGSHEKKVYLMNFKNGELKLIPKISACTISISPLKNKAAYLDFSDAVNYSGKLETGVYSIPDYKKTVIASNDNIYIKRAYKGMKASAPAWSPDGKYYIIIGLNDFIKVDVP